MIVATQQEGIVRRHEIVLGTANVQRWVAFLLNFNNERRRCNAVVLYFTPRFCTMEIDLVAAVLGEKAMGFEAQFKFSRAR